MCVAAERIKSSLELEQERTNNLSQDITNLEIQNKHLLQDKQEFIKFRELYKEKKATMKKKLLLVEQEKNKWETIAKFSHKVKECKREAAQEVYNPLY